MGKNDRKRPHAQYAHDIEQDESSSNLFGVAATLAFIQNPDRPLDEPITESSKRDIHSDGWETVERRSKMRKKRHPRRKTEKENEEEPSENGKPKSKGNRPALTYAELHQLQSCIRISDLQGLVLYCLADGTSPQWISVSHHGHVKKAVVLMVPGLEKDLFNGEIRLLEVVGGGDVDRPPPTPGNGTDASTKKAEFNQDARNGIDDTEHSYRGSNRSPDDYLPIALVSDNLPTPLKPLAGVFGHVWPVKAPGDDKYYKVHSPLHAMLTAPIPKSQEEKREDKRIKGAKPAREGKYWENKRTPITTFIASDEELLENEYTLHPACFATQQEKDRELARRRNAKQDKDHGWKDALVDQLEDGDVPEAEIQKGSLTMGRTVVAMDCEMCKVEGGEMALTRISIIGWDGTVTMDELVKPDTPIVDYLTPYSGITAAKLEPVTTTLSDIQSRLLTLLTPQTIIIGHSLNADLTALRITHPFIIDTSIIYQHPRGPPLKSSLKWLAQKYLSREIQKGHGTMGHDSIEDAQACLDLVKMKCERGIKWGTTEATGESIFKRLSRASHSGPSTTSADSYKIGAIIDHGAPERNFGAMASFCIGCTNDEEVVDGVKAAVLGDEDGAIIPGGGVDFTWARLRELESLRGWSNDNRHPVSKPDSTHSSTITTSTPAPSQSSPVLAATLSRTTQHVLSIHASLPPCTLFIVYSGTGDPRDMSRLQEMQRRFREEFKTKKWDELSVRWTDVEEQALRRACAKARMGVGLICVT